MEDSTLSERDDSFMYIHQEKVENEVEGMASTFFLHTVCKATQCATDELTTQPILLTYQVPENEQPPPPPGPEEETLATKPNVPPPQRRLAPLLLTKQIQPH